MRIEGRLVKNLGAAEGGGAIGTDGAASAVPADTAS